MKTESQWYSSKEHFNTEKSYAEYKKSYLKKSKNSVRGIRLKRLGEY